MQPHDKTLSPAPFTAPPDTLVWQLACPQCAAPEIERGDFDEESGSVPYDSDDDSPGGDETSVTVHPDRGEYASPVGTRGGFVEIRMWCAGGHAFQLVVANHKGAEYVAVVR
ncbi:hypothetical protein ACFYRD_36605 [Streptomyces hirsutus]|uniref:hypothetical protein n=1 Tax=Streptomyces hirsutus TaxID=35620 RepID=UPI0036C3B6EF